MALLYNTAELGLLVLIFNQLVLVHNPLALTH